MALPSWLKNALIQSDETTTQSEVVQQPVVSKTTNPIVVPKKRVTQVAPISTVSTETVTEDSVELDETYINHLSEFMEKNNQPGPDYLEFARSLDEMNTEMGETTPEEKIFQMTYKVGYKQNLPVPKLLETAQLYINIFSQHKKEFDAYLDDETKKSVGSKIDENSRLTKSNEDALTKIEQIKQQIVNLEQSIELNNQKIEQNNSVIETETTKLNVKKAKFTKAFNFVVGKISDDIEKIKQYLSNIK